MTANLENAICNLVNKAKADGSILRVSEAAERLAKEHGGDSRQIAALMTNAGLTSGINMELRSQPGKDSAAPERFWGEERGASVVRQAARRAGDLAG